MDGETWNVVGILPASFAFPLLVELATYRIVRLDPWVVLRKI
jgi:hypothetical protein